MVKNIPKINKRLQKLHRKLWADNTLTLWSKRTPFGWLLQQLMQVKQLQRNKFILLNAVITNAVLMCQVAKA